jgi:hypothetical protein
MILFPLTGQSIIVLQSERAYRSGNFHRPGVLISPSKEISDMKKNNIPFQATPTETAAVLSVLKEANLQSPLYKQMWLHYGETMHKAVSKGRMATPERMIALYPIFREIADEADTLV